MKLSFSTLGCPRWTFDEILARAGAYGFDGVAFRGVLGELDLTKVTEFSPGRLPETRHRLDDAGLIASMILTSARLIVPDAEIEANLALAQSHIGIAAALGAPSIRVFGGQFPIGLSHAVAVARAAERLRRLGDFAASRDVLVLLETHDDFTDPALLRRVIETANHPNVAALWDIHHPYRLLGTPMQTTWDEIGPWVRSIDIKDSIPDASARLGYRYVPLGDGEIPVADALRILSTNFYDGWLTFEWEKIWHPDLAEPEIAFPAFIATMRGLLAEV